MFLLILTTTTLSIIFSTILIPSPVALGVTILTAAFTICVLTSIISFSWVGIIIFLIYIGGILVIFAYFAAIQPNQQLTKFTPLPLLLSPPVILFLFSLTKHHTPFSSIRTQFLSPTITSLYFWYNIPILLFLGLILFLALVCVVKVSKSSLGPLRPFNYV